MALLVFMVATTLVCAFFLDASGAPHPFWLGYGVMLVSVGLVRLWGLVSGHPSRAFRGCSLMRWLAFAAALDIARRLAPQWMREPLSAAAVGGFRSRVDATRESEGW